MKPDSHDEVELTTAQIAAELALPLATVRHWVRRKLVSPQREVSHTYLFSQADLEKFRYIKERRQTGVGLEQIRHELSWFSWSKPDRQPTPPVAFLDTRASQDQTGPRMLVLANQKGGVGKTTSSINLGASLVELGHQVLIIDWDPQANASQALGLTHLQTEHGPSVFDCVHDEQLRLTQVIRPTKLPGLDLASANIQLSGLELDLANSIGRESVLRSICERQPLPYEYVIIDTPPTLGLITLNALAASEWVVIPVQAEYLSLEGVRQLINTMDIVKRRLNPRLTLAAILITMFSDTEPFAASIRHRIESAFGNKVPTICVPRTPQVVEAQMRGVPLVMLDRDSEAARAYRQLAAVLTGASASTM